MSKTIQLHCPSNKRTVDGFIISPFQSNDQIYQGVRLALQIPYAILYTVDAKPITKLDSLQEDQRVLVAAAEDECMLPDSPTEFEFYDGQECTDEEGWEDLSEKEQCEHIQTLNELDPTTRNRLRFTRQWQAVNEDLMAEKMPSGAEAESLIEQRWGLSLDHFLPSALKPAKLKPFANELWNPRIVAGLSVLASFTPGQARLAAEFLEEAVQLRVTDGDDTSTVVQMGDVINAVTLIYERAGVVPAKLTKPKSAKAREKEKKKALREKRKKGKTGIEE